MCYPNQRIKKSDHRVVYLALLLTFLHILNKLETHNQIIKKILPKKLYRYKMIKTILSKVHVSKKATQIDKIFTVYLTFTTWCQVIGEDFINLCGLLRKHED